MRTSLVAQCLTLGFHCSEAWAPSLVKEIRSHTPHGSSQNERTNEHSDTKFHQNDTADFLNGVRKSHSTVI